MSYSLNALPRPTTVEPVSLARLSAAALNAETGVESTSDVMVTGIAQSSSAVQPGDLYAALPGSKFHGASFSQKAAHAGAAAILTDSAGAAAARETNLPVLVVDNPRAVTGILASVVYEHPSSKMPVIGITGTNGKTTTSYLIASALEAAGEKVAVVGTVGVRVGDQSWPAQRTTPEAAELQAFTAFAVEQGATAMVIEASSHGFLLHRLAGMRFAVGVFTNLTPEHLDIHSTMENYFNAKAQLFADATTVPVINIDDPYGRRLREGRESAVVSVSLEDSTASWFVSDIRSTAQDQKFRLVENADGQKYDVALTLPGRFNISNATLAVAAARSVGVTGEVAVRGVEACAGVPGRMERVEAGNNDILSIVDYAHAPDSVVKALEALRPVTKGRLIAVLGCGGDRDRSKRPLMGEAAARLSDVLIATDDNPRSENPAAIRAAMLTGAQQVPESRRSTIMEVADRRVAIATAVQMAQKGDTIAVLGKGHEQGQDIAGTIFPFDDRVVLAEALNKDV